MNNLQATSRLSIFKKKICIYRPLEMERDFNWRAVGNGCVIGPDYVGVSRSKRARWLRRNHVLRVLEADSEENVTVPVSSADALRRVERMDFQLKHTRGENLEEGGPLNI